ncbi:DUF2510 domain-containing protein [Granulicoccus sp. GXG6511]|uniref:DUF2510 domain-containing protein n=1 Tax=Granulicoccus sp. GXG6511 TaxID=3381351 RepID=UPI003D7C5C31
MSAAGWYPDPGGQPGMFRYWDGSAWSAVLSPSPQSPPPSSSVGSPGDPVEEPRTGLQPTAAPEESRRGGRGWVIAAAVIVVVLVVVVGFIVRGVTNQSSPAAGDRPTVEQPICPDLDLQPPTEEASRNGRVYGGLLSYPELPAPWSPPSQEVRIPFGFNAAKQDILVDGYDVNGQRQGWVASVMVGELRAGDGFFNPQDGSAIVATCIIGGFYGDAKVTRDDRVSKAVQVDGHNGWLLETNLSFRIPGLRTDGEWLAVLIVDTGDGRSSIFSASIPNVSPEWEAPARQAMADLRVGP